MHAQSMLCSYHVNICKYLFCIIIFACTCIYVYVCIYLYSQEIRRFLSRNSHSIYMTVAPDQSKPPIGMQCSANVILQKCATALRLECINQ